MILLVPGLPSLRPLPTLLPVSVFTVLRMNGTDNIVHSISFLLHLLFRCTETMRCYEVKSTPMTCKNKCHFLRYWETFEPWANLQPSLSAIHVSLWCSKSNNALSSQRRMEHMWNSSLIYNKVREQSTSKQNEEIGVWR